MNEVRIVLIAVLALFWVYLAFRLASAAILCSWSYYKEKKNACQEKR